MSHPIFLPEDAQDKDTYMVEVLMAAMARSALNEDEVGKELAAVDPVKMVTLHRLQQAVSDSPLFQKLLTLLLAGLSKDRADWPKDLVQYHSHRAGLVAIDGAIMLGDRMLIPANLRTEILEHLHAAHHCVTRMMSRALQSVFWPSLKHNITSYCKAFTIRAPSKLAPPHTPPCSLTTPSAMLWPTYSRLTAPTLPWLTGTPAGSPSLN